MCVVPGTQLKNQSAQNYQLKINENNQLLKAVPGQPQPHY